MNDTLRFSYNGPDARCTLGGRELHCGDCFMLLVRAERVDVRIERSKDWIVVGGKNCAASAVDGFGGVGYLG